MADDKLNIDSIIARLLEGKVHRFYILYFEQLLFPPLLVNWWKSKRGKKTSRSFGTVEKSFISVLHELFMWTNVFIIKTVTPNLLTFSHFYGFRFCFILWFPYRTRIYFLHPSLRHLSIKLKSQAALLRLSFLSNRCIYVLQKSISIKRLYSFHSKHFLLSIPIRFAIFVGICRTYPRSFVHFYPPTLNNTLESIYWYSFNPNINSSHHKTFPNSICGAYRFVIPVLNVNIIIVIITRRILPSLSTHSSPS